MGKTFFLFSILFFLVITPAFSQDSPSEQIDVKADVIEYYEQGRLLVAKGNVVVTYQGTRLVCPEASVQVEAKIASCKGETIVEQEGITYKGYDLVYHFQTKSGRAHQARINAPPVYGGGEFVEQKGHGHYEIKEGYITTCDLEKPHYKITTKHITIKADDKVIAHNAVIWAGPVPILYVPSYSHSISGTDKRPKISAVPGHRKNWGSFLLTAYKYELWNGFSGNLLLDYRDNLGVGSGMTTQYHSSHIGWGQSKLYYTEERKRGLPEGTPAEMERYQTSLAHVWQMNPKTRTFIEVNKRSDASFVKDYFEREYEKENNPETHWDLTHHEDLGSVEVYARKRVHHFEAVTEKLPEFRGRLNSIRLGSTPLYTRLDTSLTNFRKKSANTGASDNVVRYDFFNKIEMPGQILNWLSTNPYIGIRETYYSRGTTEKDSLIRGIFSTGIDLSSRFFKTYGRSSSDTGAKLRHVVTPQLRYEYTHSPTVAASKITDMGGPDSLGKKSRMDLSLEQSWQGRTEEVEGGTTHPLDGYPEVEGGTTSKESYRLHDMARFLLTTAYDFEAAQGGRFDFTTADLEIYPMKGFSINADAQYDTPSKDWATFNLDLQFERGQDKKVILGHRYLNDTSTQATLEWITPLSSKWKFRAYERFSFKDFRDNKAKRINDFLEQEYTLVRDLHCWEAEFNYNRQSGEEFWIIFRLKAFGNLPFDLKQRSYAPSPGSKSRPD